MKKFHLHINAHTGIFKKMGRDPFTDWFFILLISVLSSLVFIGFGVSLFFYINGGSLVMPGTDTSSVGGTLDKADLTKLIANFQNKQVEEVLFLTGYHGSVDPSESVVSVSPASPVSPAASSTKSRSK